MTALSIIPRQLFFSTVPTGELELSTFVVFDGEAESVTWRVERADAPGSEFIEGRRALLDGERSARRVLVSLVVPPEWMAGLLGVRVRCGPSRSDGSWRVERYAQSAAYRLPLAGPVLVLGAHRIGDAHRAAWRIPSQQFAWDLLPLGSDGWRVFRRAEGDLRATSFAAFGLPVLAPAPGRVAHASDGEPDQDVVGALPPVDTFGADPARAMGNHVVIDHGANVWSFIGHLRRGSVCVGEGDQVATGSRIGSVGASGNAAGPHVHVHFMDGPNVLAASPLPIHLDVEGGRYSPQAGELLSG